MTVLLWATNDVTSAVAEEGCVRYITDYGLKLISLYETGCIFVM